MPYRESAEDPRVDAARRPHAVAEHAEVRKVVRRFADEVERVASAVAETNTRLQRAMQGTGGWLWRGPDPEEIIREQLELEHLRTTLVIARHAFDAASARERTLADVLAQSTATPPEPDSQVNAWALAASVRAAATHGRDVRKTMRDAVDLVTQAHREEMVAALSGQHIHAPALPQADRAVTIARCRIDLLRANLIALGAAMEAHVATLGEILTTLEAAGTGPGQQWKERVLAAAAQLDALVSAIDRT